MKELNEEHFDELVRWTPSYLMSEQQDTGILKNEIKEIITQLDNKIIPDSYNKLILHNRMLRGEILKRLGFSLVCTQWIKPLSQWIGNRKCLEVMSGCGSLTKALKDEGINIIATDNFSWKGIDNWNNTKHYWTEIEDMDAIESIEKYGKEVDIIIMSWAYMDDTAFRVLQTMRKVNPDLIMIYIGEGHEGCTADDEFYDSLIEIEDNEFSNINKLYPRWFGIHDCLWLIK